MDLHVINFNVFLGNVLNLASFQLDLFCTAIDRVRKTWKALTCGRTRQVDLHVIIFHVFLGNVLNLAFFHSDRLCTAIDRITKT